MAERVIEKLRQGKVVIGTAAHSSSPDFIELYAHVGFDFVLFDMMFTPIDWERAAYLINSAHAVGITPIPRVQTYPWATPEGDQRVFSEIARALAIGAKIVQLSPSCVEDIERALQIPRDYEHYKMHLYTPREPEAQKRYAAQYWEDTWVIPKIETLPTIRNVDKILELEGLKIMGIALSDAARLLGHSGDYDHPEVWALIDRVVELANRKRIPVFTNTAIAPTPEENIARIKRLVEHGVRMIMVSPPVYVLQAWLENMIERVGKEIPGFK